jgi:PAS domain S-box-containing protein
MNPRRKTLGADAPNLPLQEVTWLAGVAARIGVAETLESVAEASEAVLKRFTEFESTGLYLVDLDTGRLRLLTTRSMSEHERRVAEAMAHERHPGFVLRTGQPLQVRDAVVEPDGDGPNAPRRAVVRSRLMLPVARDGEVFGAFGLTSTQPDPFDDHDRALLSFVCDMAAIAYHRIRAERAARHERERHLQAERDSAARAQLAADRERLAADARRFTAALLEISRTAVDALPAFLRVVTEVVARTLDAERASVWRCVDDSLLLVDLFEQPQGTHSADLRLLKDDFPAYFDALATVETVVADDAHTHPATSCFSANYLTPLGIASMLDLPLRSFDGIRGVLCVETLAPRQWTEPEIRFGSDVAGFVVQALEVAMRRRVEQRQAAVLASVGEGVIACDGDLRVTLMNPVAEALAGLPMAAAVGRPLAEIFTLVTADDGAVVGSDLARVAQTRARATQLVVVRADGSRVPVALTAAPLLENDAARGVVLSLRDIGAELEARRALDERNRRLRSLGDAIPDLMFSVSRSGRLELLKRMRTDDAGNADLIVTADEVASHRLDTVFPPALAARLQRAVDDAVATGELQTVEYDIAMPQGRQIFEARLARMSDDEATAIVRNITIEREHAAALVAERERLQALLASSSAIIHSSRLPDFEIEYTSDSFTTVLGFAHEQARKPGFWEASLHPDDRERVLSGMPKLLSTGHLLHEYRHRHADGSWRWLRDDVRLIYDDQGRPIRAVGTSIDITSRRRDEVRLATILAVQQLVSRVSSAFLADRTSSIADAVHDCLDGLGRITGAGRVFAGRVTDGDVTRCAAWSGGVITDGDDVCARCRDDVLPSLPMLERGVSTSAPSRTQPGGGTLLLVPMAIDGRLRGVIGVDAPTIDSLTDEETLGLIELVADALVAGQQRVEDELALRALTERLRRRDAQQRALLDLSGDLVRATTRGELFAVVRARVPGVFGVDHVAFVKRMDDGRVRTRVFATAADAPDAVFSSDVLDAADPDSAFERALQSASVVTTHDHSLDAFADWRALAASGIRQVATLPLVGVSGLLGALVVGSRSTERWDVEDLSWAVQFSALFGGHLSTLRAGDALRRMNEELERRVDERTAELRASEERFELLFQNAPQAMVIADRSGRVVQSNRGAQSLFGYAENDFVGLPVHALLPANARERHEAHVRSFGDEQSTRARAMAAGRTVSGLRVDGTEFPAEIGLVPLLVRGEMQIVAGITDISARVAAQEAVSSSLREKEVLLKEIHHRVKNNLQIISSLLMLQSEQMPSDDARLMLRESVYRVRSMALIHQLFYGGHSLDRIDLAAYARGLSVSLAGVLAPTAKVEVVADDVAVPVDVAVPLGLILNELLTNAFKYGLPRDTGAARTRAGEADVVVEVRVEGERLRIGVVDSGPGLPVDVDVGVASTLGLQLVRSLTRQLRGELSVMRTPRAGITLRCPFVQP